MNMLIYAVNITENYQICQIEKITHVCKFSCLADIIINSILFLTEQLSQTAEIHVREIHIAS